jgi:site-specific recombinase XerD
VVPALIADAGDRAAKRFLEYFAVTIRNRNTRQAYLYAARRFFAWCEREHIGQLVDIEPLHVATYIEVLLSENFEKPAVKQHLADPQIVRLVGDRPDHRHEPGTCRTSGFV